MTWTDVRMVKALVVARCRELAGRWLQTLLLLLLATTVADGSFGLRAGHGFLVVRAVFSVFLGMCIGYFTNVPLFSWLSTGLHAVGDSAVARALPVSTLCRRVAAFVIATSLASPFLLIVLGTSLRTQRSRQTILVVIGAVLFGYVINGPLSTGTPIRVVRSLPDVWLSKLRPTRDTEVGAAFWTLLPGQLAITLFMPFVAAGTHSAVDLSMPSWDPALSLGTARFAVFIGSLGSTAPALMQVITPLANTPVSRRAISIAELRLTPLLIAITMPCTIAFAAGVAQSAELAWQAAHLAVSLNCLGVVIRIVCARVATPSMTGGHLAIPALMGLSAGFFIRPRPPIPLDTISIVAFLVAVLLAYTAPNTPLSTSPFRTDLFAFLRRSPAPPRGK